MRSTAAGRRRHSRPSPGALLAQVVRIVADAALDTEGHTAFHLVTPPGPDLSIGVLPLPPGSHPFPELAGLLAPPEWSAFGLCVHGRAHHLEERRDPVATTMAFAVDRAGHEASVALLDGALVDLPSRAEGTIPDLCRRVLARPTDPAQPSTAVLWTTRWLHDVLAAWHEPARRRAIASTWSAVAALHPAAADAVPRTPRALVRAAHAHANEHPWRALRESPDPFEVPDESLPPSVAAWMDDGFFARWVVGGYPPLPHLYERLRPLLDRDVARSVDEALLGLMTPPEQRRR
jgi:hypothetical protein